MIDEIRPLGTGKRTSRARQKFGELVAPNSTGQPEERLRWITNTCLDFVSPSSTNREYYKVILELLWPIGHGIPGPHVTDVAIRNAIDHYRRRQHTGDSPYQAYNDPFRRLRELMGEEGITGIIRSGATTQLVKLDVGEKRKPRVGLSDQIWLTIVENYKHRCPACGRSEPEVSFDQDHKIPRSRGGGDGVENWQPLCFECNNHKSMACRGCSFDCLSCHWAFPEKFAPLRIAEDLILQIRQMADVDGSDSSAVLNRILRKAMTEDH